MSATLDAKRKSRGIAERWFLAATVVIFFVGPIFVFQPFNIPSGSMEDTLLVGDYVFVSKFSYGYSHYSLPFSLQLFSGRMWASDPQRGDVVVFRWPRDDSIDYIKRVIGLPDDRIQMINGLLHINGVPVKREHVEDFVDTDENGKAIGVKRWRETLPNGAGYTTLELIENGSYDNTPVHEVPPGHVFMMGDNRDNSADSRVLSQVGYVPPENLIGRAQVVFFSIRGECIPGKCRIGLRACAGGVYLRSCGEVNATQNRVPVFGKARTKSNQEA